LIPFSLQQHKQIIATFCVLLSFDSGADADSPALNVEEEVNKDDAIARLYRTREEQREVGLKRHITSWLTISGLVEIEGLYEDYDVKEGKANDSGHDDSSNIQLGYIATPWAFTKAELIMEYDSEEKKVTADEAVLSLEAGPWEIALGKQYLPFGVFYSNFVSGPLIEFGETQVNKAATVAYGPSDAFDLSIFVYQGKAKKSDKRDGQWDWGIATEVWLNTGWGFGLSYQSDLADADSQPLNDENNRYANQVPGISAYLLWVAERFEITLEGLAATDSFRELEPDRNKPLAWNAELAYFVPTSNFVVAFRIEGSEDLEGAPNYQFGTAVSWRTGKYASLTIEYLHGEFEGELTTNDDDIPYKNIDRFGIQVSVAF